jgi:hypothetical protein
MNNHFFSFPRASHRALTAKHSLIHDIRVEPAVTLRVLKPIVRAQRMFPLVLRCIVKFVRHCVVKFMVQEGLRGV